jgi:hypothetical protein
MKKFSENDVFISTLKVYPKVSFFGNSGIVYYNNTNEKGVLLNDFLLERIPAGAITNELGEPLLTESGDYIIIE